MIGSTFPSYSLSSIQLSYFPSEQHEVLSCSLLERKSLLTEQTSEASTALRGPSLSSTIDTKSVNAPTMVGKGSASSTLNDESSEASTIIADDIGDSPILGKLD